MTTVDKLLDATKEIWQSYNTHPFVQGIADGTLEERKFRYYILQDYLYLQDYAKVFAVGVAKSKNQEVSNIFFKYLNLLVTNELNIHHGYMGKFKISQTEVDNMPVALDNLSYTSYMLRVAYEEGDAEILTAILSCAYSYELIAKNMVEKTPNCTNHHLYCDWIKGYNSNDYKQGNVMLIDVLNKLTTNYTEKQIQHLIDIFVACSRYEYLFWELSYNMSK